MNIIERAVQKLDQEPRDTAEPSDKRHQELNDDSVSETDRLASLSALETPIDHAEEAESEPISHKVRINLEKLSSAGFITLQTADSRIAEQCRYIKRPLLSRAAKNDDRDKLIMVASALTGEGKTFMAINLAMSIAMEIDRNVCLVDADVLRPSICKLFNVKAEHGLTDLLAGAKLELSDVILKTNVSSLDLLPSGEIHDQITELFASAKMGQVMTELSRRYDIVIFDSMPVLAESGVSVLASLMGQIVFVVESVKTSRRVVQEALNVLGPHGGIGLVLNKSREHFGHKYGYHNYYGHARR